MDGFNLFNIGFGEFAFILILAGLVMGPQRIRQVARYLGNLTARLQRISREFTRQLNAELDAAEREEMRAAIDDLKALRQEFQDLRREVMQGPGNLYKEGQQAFDDARMIGASTTTESVEEPSKQNGSTPPQIETPEFELPSIVDVEDDPE